MRLGSIPISSLPTAGAGARSPLKIPQLKSLKDAFLEVFDPQSPTMFTAPNMIELPKRTEALLMLLDSHVGLAFGRN